MTNDELFLSALSSVNNTLANNANVLMASNMSKGDQKFSREMSDLAWKRNIEAWNMQNEYNLPTNVYRRQIQGLLENGMNPNLVYGNSSSVTGSAGAISPYKFEGYHSTAVPRFGMDNSINAMLSTRLLQTQVEAQEANNRYINARADNEEARLPGTRAKANEAAYRWDYISNEISDSYEAGIRAQVATEYWKGVQTEYNAHYAKDRSTIEYYEACMAEWLNTSYVPGTNYTYQQYFERYKSMIPKEQYDRIKADTLYIGAKMKYLEEQKQYLLLKEEYQRYVNQFAKYGQTLSSGWFSLLLGGIFQLLGGDPIELAKKYASDIGDTQTNMPATYPGP